MTPFILTLTGPSCAGKSTLEARLKKEGFESIISTTTRQPRAGEVNGESYYFVNRAEFEHLRTTGQLVESVEFNGKLYGVEAREVQRVAAAGKPIVVIVEPKGLGQIRAYCDEHHWAVHSVFVSNPPNVIARRFIDRLTEDFKGALANEGWPIEKTRDTYAKRLGVMMSEELSWDTDAAFEIDQFLETFDESNIESIVQELDALASDVLGADEESAR